MVGICLVVIFRIAFSLGIYKISPIQLKQGMKKILLLFLVTYFLVVPLAQAVDYVLPYPSYMPGNPMYKIRQILERAQEYWYFGDMAKVKYHLKMADKYLVEAKTLFEYKQYLLAVDALQRSNQQFQPLPQLLERVKIHLIFSRVDIM